MNDVFLFVVAIAASRYGIAVHACCVLSNHVHLVLTDRAGVLPAFMQYLDSVVARAMNASLGRFEGFWARDGSYSAVEPLEPGDIVAKTAYVLANPVAAGLVRRAADWPGIWTSPDRMGTTKLTARRPRIFFDPKGYLPEQIDLELTTPPGFESAEFRALVTAALEELEGKHREEIAAQGRRFLGVARVLAQNPFSRPAQGEPRFRLKPRIAARDKWKRVEGLLRLKSFVAEYRAAVAAWRTGYRDVLFPVGTYLLRVLHGAQCAGAA